MTSFFTNMQRLLLRFSRQSGVLRLYCTATTDGSESAVSGEQPSKGKEITVATSSLRVDTIAAAGLDISRK